MYLHLWHRYTETHRSINNRLNLLGRKTFVFAATTTMAHYLQSKKAFISSLRSSPEWTNGSGGGCIWTSVAVDSCCAHQPIGIAVAFTTTNNKTLQKKKTIINLIKFASSIDRFVFRCNTTTTPIEIGVEQWIKFVIVIVCWRRRQRKKWYIFLLWCDANAKRNKSKFTCFIVSAEKINRSDS